MLYFSHDDLITLTDANYSKEPDFSLTLELVDAMRDNYDQTMVVIMAIIDGLNSSQSPTWLKTIKFLEILVKNCQISFHKVLFTPKFCETILKILIKRRGKSELFNSLVSGNK